MTRLLRRVTRPQAVTVMFAAVLATAVGVTVGRPVVEWVVAWFVGTLHGQAGVWSLITMAASVAGLVLGGYNPRWGWWMGLPTQVVWTVAGIVLDRPGDIILSMIFVPLYVRNLRRNRGQKMYRTDDFSRLTDQVDRLLVENASLRGQVDSLRLRLATCPDPAETAA